MPTLTHIHDNPTGSVEVAIPSSAEGGSRGGYRANSPTRSPVLRASISTPAGPAGDPSPNLRAGRSRSRSGSNQGLNAVGTKAGAAALSPLAAADTPSRPDIDVTQWSFATGEEGGGASGKGGVMPERAREFKEDDEYDEGPCSPDTSSFARMAVNPDGGRGGFAQVWTVRVM